MMMVCMTQIHHPGNQKENPVSPSDPSLWCHTVTQSDTANPADNPYNTTYCSAQLCGP